MRRLATMLLAGASCGCLTSKARPQPRESPIPALWVEAPPKLGPTPKLDVSAWSGVWTEHFPGRSVCQDRFELQAEGATLTVETSDCATDQPYTIREVRWDGQILRFIAEPPDSEYAIHYTVSLDGPEKISGTANETRVTWSRTEPSPGLKEPSVKSPKYR